MTQHPAGWYPQPDGSQRYWDGTQWTQAPGPGPDYAQALGHGAPGDQTGLPYGGHGQQPYSGGYPAAAQETTPTKKPWFTRKRVVIPAVLVAALVILAQLGGNDDDVAVPAATASATQARVSETPTTEAPPTVEEPVAEEAAAEEAAAEIGTQGPAEPAVVQEEPAPAPEPEAEPAAVEPAGPELTVSQQQAVRKAEDYLRLMPFSRAGLVGQLEFEGFSNEDATFAADHITVDWNQQAVLKAESYLDLMPFSKSGLIEQLEYEEFTPEQASFGVGTLRWIGTSRQP